MACGCKNKKPKLNKLLSINKPVTKSVDNVNKNNKNI